MALTDKLTAIADAIRAKDGSTALLTLDEMPEAIAAIEVPSIPDGGGSGGSGDSGEYFTDEDLIFGNECDYLFARDRWQKVIEKEKGRIKIVNPTRLSNLFYNSTGTDYSWLTIEDTKGSTIYATYTFGFNEYVTKLPVIKSKLILNGNQSYAFFQGCKRLKDVNEIIKFLDKIEFTNSTFQSGGWFQDCYSLRNIDSAMPYIKKTVVNYTARPVYSSFFSNCFGLDEINNILIFGGDSTSNSFSQTFLYCRRLKNVTFETNEDGTPKVARWKGQTIDLTFQVGYAPNGYQSYFLNYNSGITADKEVKDDATYQALKNDADWFATNEAYSRYNHDSAVNTINSLPDTSAYLASAGGTNTIKFQGKLGSATDGGAINTLTEEEIAVAAAKGWTVTLT